MLEILIINTSFSIFNLRIPIEFPNSMPIRTNVFRINSLRHYKNLFLLSSFRHFLLRFNTAVKKHQFSDDKKWGGKKIQLLSNFLFSFSSVPNFIRISKSRHAFVNFILLSRHSPNLITRERRENCAKVLLLLFERGKKKIQKGLVETYIY